MNQRRGAMGKIEEEATASNSDMVSSGKVTSFRKMALKIKSRIQQQFLNIKNTDHLHNFIVQMFKISES